MIIKFEVTRQERAEILADYTDDEFIVKVIDALDENMSLPGYNVAIYIVEK